jgi:rhodanese-related sulfurtransferase
MTAAIVVAAALLPLAASAPSPAAQSPLATVQPGDVDGATGKRLAAAGAVVVDVRTPEEFARGHVPGAKNIPHDEIAARAAEIGPPSTPVVVYCRSGRRSALAIESLKELGYRSLWNAGGYDGWPRDEAPAGAAKGARQ